ncbi:hypothetical protein [Shewanella sp. Actino-trap-3]|uniref:hypothetical protein n=1 Tax=Shewanella sp. Actino-trap-3 TaxID=2058331 RepID=UPI001E63FB82|nr:hypothetical protein [Shewanella sp. Actino-trap-3]
MVWGYISYSQNDGSREGIKLCQFNVQMNAVMNRGGLLSKPTYDPLGFKHKDIMSALMPT